MERKALAVPWYIMASYAYYVESDPKVTDGCYDLLAKLLSHYWDSIVRQHKHLITKEDLLAGTGFAIEFPSRIKHAVHDARALYSTL
jgi:NAD-dependent DNA ligase